MVLFIIPLMLALTWGGRQYAWLSPTTLAMLGFSALMLILFLKQEGLSQEPLIPLEIFKRRILSVSAVSVFILGIAFFSCSTFMPLFLQGVLGSTPTLSGMMTTPMILGMVVGGITSGQILSRAGGHYRLQAAVGFALLAAGLFLLSRMTPATSYRTVVFNMILVGLGQGVILPLHMIAVQNIVPYSILGTATALLNLVRTLGGIFGLAILGSAMNNVFYSEFMGNILPGIKAVIQTDQLSEIANNPQVLVNPEAQNHLKSLFVNLGTNGQTLFEQMLTTMQNALNFAIVNAFLISFGAIVLAFMINFFLEEIPLRRSIRDE
jgi:MFS family permease